MFYESGFMKVSIIIPVYNVEKEIVRCLSSVVCQDYPNLELVLVNDYTPDASFRVAVDYLRKSSALNKALLIEHEVNRGLSAARNSGVARATGDYICFLDSDDALACNSVISQLVDQLIENKYPEMIIGGYERISHISEIYSYKTLYYRFPEDAYNDYVCKKLNDYACGKLVSRKYLQDKGIQFLDNIYHEDTLWSFYVFRQIETLLRSDVIIFKYYERDGSITSSYSKKRISDFITVIEMIYEEYLRSSNVYPKDTAYLLEDRRREILHRLCFFSEDIPFIKQELSRLRRIKITPFTKKFSHFKQNILFRFPLKLIVYYFVKYKWKN